MESTFCSIIGVTKYSGPAVLLAPRAMTQEVLAPMCSQSTANDPVRIPLHSKKYPNLFALVDAEDANRVLALRWSPKISAPNTIYAKTGNGRRHPFIYLHRFILGLSSGDPVVDHRNGDGRDNRKSNLRMCTKRQNQWNHFKHTNNTSGFKGVYWQINRNKWNASITVNRSKTHIGTYDSKIDAAIAYDNAARDHFGEFARLNFPLEEEQSA